MSDTRREAGGARRETRGARFDEAIDRAVREMLDVEPPAGLRGRVLDRIDVVAANSAASAFRRNFGLIAVPVAAAVIIVLAVLAPWRQAVKPVSPTAPVLAKTVPSPVAPVVEPPNRTHVPGTMSIPPRMPGQRSSPRVVVDRPVVAAVAIVDVNVDSNATLIDPLEPIAPITVAGARPQDITPKQIAISPLTPIAELQIAPLSPPDRRN